MKRKMCTPDADLRGHCHPMKTRFRGQTGDSVDANTHQSSALQAPASAADHIMHLLATRLSPVVLQTYKHKLDIFRKCSFYIRITQQDLPQHAQNNTSALMYLIDPWRFQRMKKLANSQVKIQLALLQELYHELKRGREELETILDQKGFAFIMLEEAAIQQKIFRLVQAAADFEAVMVPGPLHLKHRLISEVDHTRVPQIRLALHIKMPVMFDKTQSTAFSDSAVLHWHIAGLEQHEPGEQFEIRYKLLYPTNEDEGKQTSTVTCTTYCVKISDLIPNKCYEFSVKRVDCCFLVYNLWNEAIILRTVSGVIQSSGVNSEKKRRLFPL